MSDIYRTKTECALRNKAKDVMSMVTHYSIGNRVDILDIRKQCEDLKFMVFAEEPYKLANRSDACRQ